MVLWNLNKINEIEADVSGKVFLNLEGNKRQWHAEILKVRIFTLFFKK